MTFYLKSVFSEFKDDMSVRTFFYSRNLEGLKMELCGVAIDTGSIEKLRKLPELVRNPPDKSLFTMQTLNPRNSKSTVFAIIP